VKITVAQIKKVLNWTIKEQERQLTELVAREAWREVADKAAYLDGLRFAFVQIEMLQIEED
jgi:hypothetical protein